MKKNNFNFQKALDDYIIYLKKKNLYNKTRNIFYENNIERLNNWSNSCRLHRHQIDVFASSDKILEKS